VGERSEEGRREGKGEGKRGKEGRGKEEGKKGEEGKGKKGGGKGEEEKRREREKEERKMSSWVHGREGGEG